MKNLLNSIVAFLFVALSILLSSAIISIGFGLSVEFSIVLSLGIAVSFSLMEKYSFKFRSFGFGFNFITICGKIKTSIGKDCVIPLQAGVRDKAWIINFEDVESIVYGADDETIEDIILISGAVAYSIDGANNSIKPKGMLAPQTYDNMFDHQVEVIGFDISPTVKAHLNAGKNGRYIVVTENFYKGTNGESAFEVYGTTTGMEITVLERDPNDQETQGAFKVTFLTKLNKEPKMPNAFFDTNYSTTKAIIEGLL